MKSLKAIFGYIWAILLIPVLLITFIGMNSLAENFIGVTGLKISPLYTGGEIIATIHREQYEIVIHRAVFEGLFAPPKEGFVQIDWQTNGRKLPDIVSELIDYDQDGTTDFEMDLNTKINKALLVSTNPHVQKIGEVITLGSGRVVRVILKN